MKLQYFIIILLIFTFSCEDFLEITPVDRISDKTLWKESSVADLFLKNIYATYLPSPWNVYDNEEAFSDNAINTLPRFLSRAVYKAGIMGVDQSAVGTLSCGWSKLYGGIRQANLFIEKVNESELDEDWKTKRLGEARFLRAYMYSMLWTTYGGVPIITDVLDMNTQGDEIYRARNTAEETYNFIIDECDAINDDLLITANEVGRVTRGTALSLKAYCQLFWASPLYNTSNDKSRWATAAATYKSIMNMGQYQLFPSYSEQFLEENNNNSEVIFARQFLAGSYGSCRTGLYAVYKSGGGTRGWGMNNPTQELVDCYCMANGLPIDDPGSGYDPQNPYANREKRFYDDITYDGSIWLDEEVVTVIGVGSLNELDINDAGHRTNTGYYWLKMMDERYTIGGCKRLESGEFKIYRYAETLLSYAEAQNEAEGPDASVYQAINDVRIRAELPPLEGGMTQAEIREAIYRERRVELSFEEKRWRDLLRLRLAEEKLDGTSHAMQITLEGGEKVYTVIPTPGGSMTFDPSKNYLFPIPRDVLEKNPNITQNPNY